MATCRCGADMTCKSCCKVRIHNPPTPAVAVAADDLMAALKASFETARRDRGETGACVTASELPQEPRAVADETAGVPDTPDARCAVAELLRRPHPPHLWRWIALAPARPAQEDVPAAADPGPPGVRRCDGAPGPEQR